MDYDFETTYAMCESVKLQTQALAVMEESGCSKHQKDRVWGSVACNFAKVGKDMGWR